MRMIRVMGMAVMMALPAAAMDTNQITFTNGASVVRGAIPVRVEHSFLIYHYPDGGGGMVKLSALPAALRARFGYDEWQAAADDDEDRIKKEQRARAALASTEAATARAERMERLKDVFENGNAILGKVIQRIDDGLLIDAEHPNYNPKDDFREAFAVARRDYAEEAGKPVAWIKDPQSRILAEGTVLLVNYPGWRRVFDGDRITSVAYEIGEYEYVTVSGAKKTIRKYSASLAEAVPAWK